MEITKLFGDKAQQEDGKWVRHESGAEFKLRYSESKDARNYVTKRMSRARRKSRQAFISGEVVADITLDLLVEKIVVDWRGIEKDGVAYAFNKDHCRYLLENSAVLRDFISLEAQDPENFGIAVEPEPEDEPEGGGAAS